MFFTQNDFSLQKILFENAFKESAKLGLVILIQDISYFVITLVECVVKLSFLSSVTLYHAFDIKSFWKKEMGLVRTDKSKVSMPITANL